MMYSKEGSDNQQDAAQWWQKASELGHYRAQFNLGCLYELGKGVEVDLDRAVYWWTKAAQQGYEKAKSKLKSENQSIVPTGKVGFWKKLLG